MLKRLETHIARYNKNKLYCGTMLLHIFQELNQINAVHADVTCYLELNRKQTSIQLCRHARTREG